MEVLRRPGRRYRRFRYENRYDTPILIFVADTSIMLAKLALLVAALLVMWVLADRFRHSTQSSAVEVVQESTEAPAPTAAKQPAITEATTAVANIETQPIATAPVKPDLVDEQWITRLNPEQFIVQYGSSVDLELIEEFIPVINNAEKIAIYPFKKTPSGRLVYGIATGVYTDLDTALASLDDLPAEARAYEPWVRPVNELIKQINFVTQDARGL